MGVCTHICKPIPVQLESLLSWSLVEIAAQTKLCCNLKTIYQSPFGVTPIGAIRFFLTTKSQEDFQLKEINIQMRRDRQKGESIKKNRTSNGWFRFVRGKKIQII